MQEELLAEKDLTAQMEELSPGEVSFQPVGIRLVGAKLPWTPGSLCPDLRE